MKMASQTASRYSPYEGGFYLQFATYGTFIGYDASKAAVNVGLFH